MRRVVRSEVPPYLAIVRGLAGNVVKLTNGTETVVCLAIVGDFLEEDEIALADPLFKGISEVNVEFLKVDVTNVIDRVRLSPKYRNALVGMPVLPNSSIYVDWHNRVTKLDLPGDSIGFIGVETNFGKYDRVNMDNITELPVDKHISDRILRMIHNRHRIVSKTMLVCGGGGTGKSHLLKYMKRHILECRELKLIQFVDELEASKTSYIEQILKDFEEGILLVDDICVLEKQAAAALVTYLESLLKYPVLVIAASREPSYMLPFVLQQLFPFALNINSLCFADRKRIISESLRDYSENSIDFVAKETSGLTRGELETVCSLLCSEPFNEELVRTVLSTVSVSEKPLLLKPTSQKIAGYDVVVKEIKLFLSVALSDDPAIRARLQYNGLLLHGPSGNGKSLLIRKISESFDVPFFVLEFDKVFSRYFGESEKGIRDIFTAARFFAPSVIVIEDVDAIGGKRSDESGVGGRVLTTLLNEIEGISQNRQVVVLGTTNSPKMVDSALMRPGRFDRLIEIPNPEEDDRIAIFNLLRSTTPVCESVTSESLSAQTDGFSCAEIQSFFRFSALQALRDNREKVTKEYFDMGMARLLERRQSIDKNTV